MVDSLNTPWPVIHVFHLKLNLPPWSFNQLHLNKSLGLISFKINLHLLIPLLDIYSSSLYLWSTFEAKVLHQSPHTKKKERMKQQLALNTYEALKRLRNRKSWHIIHIKSFQIFSMNKRDNREVHNDERWNEKRWEWYNKVNKNRLFCTFDVWW